MILDNGDTHDDAFGRYYVSKEYVSKDGMELLEERERLFVKKVW